MIPKRQILPPSWMTDYKTVKIMEILGGYERPPESLFVGGCVRNAFLSPAVTDIDIATLHHPLKVIERLNKAGIRYVPTGLEHGTVTAIYDEVSFEITTLRKDVDTDGRHAVIAFTEKWGEDAARRDFTINTLLATPDGMIFDPTGRGLEDLDARRVVFVGEPEKRIAEDYLRILRFFRFHALYGQGKADENALAACDSQAINVEKLSAERVTQELFKILMVPKPADILALMVEQGVLANLLKDFMPAMMERLCDIQDRQEERDALTRLFALTKDGSAMLSLSNAQKTYLADIEEASGLLKKPTKKKMREAVYRHGNGMAVQAYFYILAGANAFPDMELLDIARYWQAPIFPVTGDDMIAVGVLPGPELGKKLKTLENLWVKSDFKKIPKKFNFA